MSFQTAWSECLGFLGQKPVVVENSAGQLSSDAGLLVVREFDERVGLTRQFAAVVDDLRQRRRRIERLFQILMRLKKCELVGGKCIFSREDLRLGSQSRSGDQRESFITGGGRPETGQSAMRSSVSTAADSAGGVSTRLTGEVGLRQLLTRHSS